MEINKIKTAFNGCEAIKIIKEEASKGMFFNIIVLDCNMPVLDGFETTKIIREMESKREINYVNIIALTANISKLLMKKFVRLQE